MICSTCHSEILGDAKFCNRCGASVRVVSTVRYAGFWLRVLAVVIDLILLAPAIEFGKEVCFQAVWRTGQETAAEFSESRTRAEDLAATLATARQMADFGTLIFFIAAPYYILTECSALQGTLGKRLLGVRVTDLDGRRLLIGRASLRYAARLLSALPWQFGFVMAGFTSKKQGLHDILARTLVVVGEKPAETAASDWSAPSQAACSACARPLPMDALYCSWCGGAAFRPRPRLQYAGIGRKAAALLLDWLILAALLVLLFRLVPPVSGRELRALQQFTSDAVTLAERQNLQTRMLFLSGGILVAIFLVSGFYSVLLESSRMQATLGKWMLGLRVTGESGARIGPWRALARFLAHLLSFWLWLAGYVMAAFTPKQQALHDILAETVVIIAKKADSSG